MAVKYITNPKTGKKISPRTLFSGVVSYKKLNMTAAAVTLVDRRIGKR